MSLSLIIFGASGQIHYQYNAKVHPFNELVANLVNDTCLQVEPNFYTTTVGLKRFYVLKERRDYVALYFDAVSTLDRARVRQTLGDIWRTYARFVDEGLAEGVDKLQRLVGFQVELLLKQRGTAGAASGGAAATAAAITSAAGAAGDASAGAATKPKKATSKKLRKWDGEEMVEGDGAALDFSESGGADSATGDAAADPALAVDQAAFRRENDLYLVNELNEILAGAEEASEGDDAAVAAGGFFSKISSFFGGAVPIDTLSKEFCSHLIAKNISPVTAAEITDKIRAELRSQPITKQTYRQALETELTKILTPNVLTDLLHEIKAHATGRPYVILVVGVNGVGKSTNLAKLAYWFLQNNLSVLICACDTFRLGAVEQLKVHVGNLQRLALTLPLAARIDLFEKGYGGGDHVVATARLAIEWARAQHYDVVLIDTAGRTHSNAKLMAPLKKFGDAADPDRIVMVGEALVGSDSVEQAQNFNKAFGNRRHLDFFIISKVDTVGDLVGAMINMVMATRVPILFVGTGQTYTDIKRLSVKRVVQMLMQ